MKLPRFSLRDLFWLVLVCATVVAWWREFHLRADLQSHQKQTDQAINDLAKLTDLEIEERAGEYVFSKRKKTVTPEVTACPVCQGLLLVDDTITQAQAVDSSGEGMFCWRHTGTCADCGGRFVCVVMPADAPGYGRWLPLQE